MRQRGEQELFFPGETRYLPPMSSLRNKRGADLLFMTLEQSYRTTVEIMEEANKVISRAGLEGVPPARPVIRHGSPVEVNICEDLPACARAIDKKITAYREAGHHSIAVIGKTTDECEELKKLLKAAPELIRWIIPPDSFALPSSS